MRGTHWERGGEEDTVGGSVRARIHVRRVCRRQQHRQHGVHAGEGRGVQRQLAEGVAQKLVRASEQQLRHHLADKECELSVGGNSNVSA